MAQFRLVHIAPYTASSGWYTVQRDDYFPLHYPQVKEHQEELAALVAKETMTAGRIGDLYSEWKDWDLLPEWAVEPLETERAPH